MPKEDFYAIFDAKSVIEAQARYAAWYRRLTPETHAPFADLVRAWENWQPYILNYFDHPITNAYTESLNNLIRVMNRLGRGYSFEALRAKLLFAEGAFKREIERPKFERRAWADDFDQMPADAVGFATMSRMFSAGPSTQPAIKERNYGPDISTLARMIESGQV